MVTFVGYCHFEYSLYDIYSDNYLNTYLQISIQTRFKKKECALEV